VLTQSITEIAKYRIRQAEQSGRLGDIHHQCVTVAIGLKHPGGSIHRIVAGSLAMLIEDATPYNRSANVTYGAYYLESKID
jgi:hypothetical protein